MTKNKHILITGASSGIGRALAHRFAQLESPRISLVARRTHLLEELRESLPCRSASFYADLSADDGLEPLLESVEKENGPVDILINNAGTQLIGSMAGFDWSGAAGIMTLDLIAPLRLQHLVLQRMLKNNSGHIINITSLAGKIPLEGSGYYCAAKSGFSMASEVLSKELKHENIKVLTVYPGPIQTELAQSALDGLKDNFAKKYMPMGTTEKMASAVFRSYLKGHSRLVYPNVYRLANVFPNLTRYASSLLMPGPRA